MDNSFLRYLLKKETASKLIDLIEKEREKMREKERKREREREINKLICAYPVEHFSTSTQYTYFYLLVSDQHKCNLDEVQRS